MTFEQMNDFSGITKDEWNGYVREGLIENKENCADGFNDADVKKISYIRFLLKIGMKKSELKEYFSFLEKSETERAVKLLRNARETLLADIHEKQKYLDILDCIIRETKEIRDEMKGEKLKKVLILSGSPRKGGNSDLLCDEFMRGALESGNAVEKIRVAEKNIGYCKACYYCKKSGGQCVIKDDMADILQKMIDADVIVLASPVYFYSIDAQLKAVIDRSVARWLEVKDKEFYYIITCADEEKESCATTLACFRGYADCVEGAKEMGVIYGTGVYEKGKIKGKEQMKQAYETGRNVSL